MTACTAAYISTSVLHVGTAAAATFLRRRATGSAFHKLVVIYLLLLPGRVYVRYFVSLIHRFVQVFVFQFIVFSIVLVHSFYSLAFVSFVTFKFIAVISVESAAGMLVLTVGMAAGIVAVVTAAMPCQRIIVAVFVRIRVIVSIIPPA